MTETDANRFGEHNVLMRIRQQPCLPINTVDPDVIAIAAGTKQIASIGRNLKITGMNACKLIADLCQPSCLLIDFKYRDSIRFQTITGIQKLSIGREVDIRSAMTAHRIGLYLLYTLHFCNSMPV